MSNRPSTNRRQFLRDTVIAGGALTGLTSFRQRLLAGQTTTVAGYGPLHPVEDETTGLELLQLPDGFRYRSFGWTRDRMTDGRKTPGVHDGMAVVAEQDGVVTLIRNHEIAAFGGSIAGNELSYDPAAGGGCTTLRFDTKTGEWLDAWASLSGTVRNCAGGPTPWGTWLSCEETTDGPGAEYKGKKLGYTRDHGFVFEVPADGMGDAKPLTDMGRFWHEAVAVDPATGIVYETEDRSTAGFFRFLPYEPGKLSAGGRFQMAKLGGTNETRVGQSPGRTYDVSWIDIDDPTLAHTPGTNDTQGVFVQGYRQGGAVFGRLEGCAYHDGSIYVTATIGGNAQKGQVWKYTPTEEQLVLLYESPGENILDMPDNLTVSPRGGLVLCEDGFHKPQRMHGLTATGQLFLFAANNVVLHGEKNKFKGDYRAQEWAGATFSSDGQWLFANVQDPGITVAITGPWSEGLI